MLFWNACVVTQESQIGNKKKYHELEEIFSWASCGKFNLRTHLQGDNIRATHSQNAVATKTELRWKKLVREDFVLS